MLQQKHGDGLLKRLGWWTRSIASVETLKALTFPLGRSIVTTSTFCLPPRRGALGWNRMLKPSLVR